VPLFDETNVFKHLAHLRDRIVRTKLLPEERMCCKERISEEARSERLGKLQKIKNCCQRKESCQRQEKDLRAFGKLKVVRPYKEAGT